MGARQSGRRAGVSWCGVGYDGPVIVAGGVAGAGDGGWGCRSKADGAGCGLDRAGRQVIK